MLFRSAQYEHIRAGVVTVAFRRWRRPTVAEGGSLRTPAGVLRIDEVTVIDPDEITVADARAAGFESPEAVLASAPAATDRQLYRIRFRCTGDDPRIELRSTTALTDADRDGIDSQLDRWDRASDDGPWTRRLVDEIAEHPGERSADLARRLGVDQQRLKRRVRRLKELGLTESLEIGYRLAPRGAAYRDRPSTTP